MMMPCDRLCCTGWPCSSQRTHSGQRTAVHSPTRACRAVVKQRTMIGCVCLVCVRLRAYGRDAYLDGASA